MRRHVVGLATRETVVVALATVFFFALSTVLACSSRTQGDRVVVGLAIPSYVHAVAWIAEDAGLFVAERLDARVDTHDGSAAALRALVAGRIDVALAGGDAALKAKRAGADVVVIGELVPTFYHRLVVRTDAAASDASLRGRTIAVPFFGGPQHMLALHALRTEGLVAGRDAQLVSLGSEASCLAALARGDVHATTSASPDGQLAARGLVAMTHPPARFPYLAVVTTRAHLVQRRDAVRRTMAALCRAAHFYRDPANDERALAILARRLTGGDDAAAARASHAWGGPSRIVLPPVPEADGYRVAAALASATPVDDAELDALLDTLLDRGIVDELVAAGPCRAR